MNFGEIKAFMGAKPPVNPNDAVQNQLRESGLEQAREGLNVNLNKSVSAFSSQTSIGVRVYNNSLNQTIQLDEKRANLPTPNEPEKGLFDFEEIAKNVLRFVGGVISSAARNGADDDKLTSLFEQARSGVAKGIKMAENDLQGLMNEEISDGIASSAELIEQGIKRLEDELFGRINDDPQQEPKVVSQSQVSQSISASSQQSGELSVRTRDGDEVFIRFSDVRAFEFDQQAVIRQQDAQSKEDTQIERNDVLPPKTPETDANEPSQAVQPEQVQTTPNDSVQQNDVSVSQRTLTFSEQNFSFSVNGELDEAELEAIGNLVSDANDLAETFFKGDLQTAFDQALQIGFDDQELTGFALQLTRQEQVEVVTTYESVSQYDGNNNPAEVASRPVRQVSDYLEKMLNVLEQSQQKLADSEQYEKLINGLINRVQDVGTTDLVTAINDFHAFNKKLLSNLPNQQES